MATEPRPDPSEPLAGFRFFAVLGTWLEGDVVADTVANAFAQGVERVFVVDNASPDDTVERARSAGAELAASFTGDGYDELLRIAIMNEVVHHHSRVSDADHVWWLWLDADEFPRPQGPGTLSGVLRALDRRYRIVGARFLNHYPSPGAPAHVPGRHPVEQQPMCEELSLDVCVQGHRKHPLQRWDRSGPRLDAGPGFHRAECSSRPLLEPPEPIVVHHFPFRAEEHARHRMDILWSGGRAREGDLATDHMEARRRSLDAVYRGDWTNVHTFMPGAPPLGVQLVDWRALDPPITPEVPHW